MAYNRNQAKALCTAGEYQLFEASLADQIKEHTPAQLRAKIKRARSLRDKYRDLLKRQRLANRARTGTKKGQRVDSNARTEQKARLFDEALGRFERRVDQDERTQEKASSQAAAKPGAAARRSGAKAAASSRQGSKSAASARQGSRAGGKAIGSRGKAAKDDGASRAGFISEAAKGASRRQRLQQTRSKAVQGHTRSVGRRNQARRDSRR